MTVLRADMEVRRLSAAADLLKGMPQSVIARKYGVARMTVNRWSKAASQGLEAMAATTAPGRPHRLSVAEDLAAVSIYNEGPRASGIDADYWTTALFAKAVLERLGVRYNGDHMGRVMHRLGLTVRKRGVRKAAA